MKKIKPIQPSYGINWKTLKGRLDIIWRILVAIFWIIAWIGVVLRCYDVY